MKRMYPRMSLALVLMLLAVQAFASERKFSKDFSVAAGGTLHVKTDCGSVSVQPSSGNSVSVEAVVKGTSRRIEKFEITAVAQGNDVVIEGNDEGDHGGWFNSDNLNVEFRITVPSKYNLDVKTSGGSLSFEGIEGTTNGRTSGGSVSLSEMKGPQDVKSSGGSISARKINGTLQGHTSGGSILIESIVGDVHVSTSGGSVSVTDVAGEVDASTSGGGMTIGVSKEFKGVRVKSSGGGITVTVPKNIAATIDASTSGGSVSCDLPVTVSGTIESSKLQGTMNGGGKQIYAHTSGGSIHIRGSGE